MKHSLKITLVLILIFVISQLIGLNIISNYVDIKTTSETGETVINEELYFVEPPQVENESNSWIFIMVPLLIGTMIFLLLVKFKLKKVWKAWFFLSIFLALGIAFYPYVLYLFNLIGLELALSFTLVLSLFLTYYKIFKHNLFIHNFTEVFVYGGIAALFVPIINITSGIILLILIAIYDAYAVWKSKHMIKMAEFQTDSGIFAGLSIPYSLGKKKKRKSDPSGKAKTKLLVKERVAILGGGDVAFPMIFSGAVLKMTGLYWPSLFIIVGASVGLSVVLIFGKKGRFYPAMPFISSGCLLGYLLTLLF